MTPESANILATALFYVGLIGAAAVLIDWGMRGGK